MGKNKDANRRATRHIQNLPEFNTDQLLKLCKVLGAETSRRAKGGAWQQYEDDELRRSIRSVIGRGAFADNLTRFADMADEFLTTK